MPSKPFDLLINHPCRNYEIEPNPSYWNSVKNGLTAGLWWIPQTLFLLVRQVLVPCMIGIGYVGLVLVLMLFWHLLWLVSGFTGRLRDRRVTIEVRPQ